IMEEKILKHCLINAVKYGGKAKVDAVLGKILAENPELKEKREELLKKIKEAVKEVNSLSLDEQKRKLKELGIEIEKPKVEKKELPPLPNAEVGKVVMRLAPYPSGPLHIGNARMVILNDEYVKRYKGKLFLVIDDTIGSEEKFVIPEAYEMIVDGLEWLGVKWDELVYKSDRLEIFYKNAEELIKKGLAYVCECDAETLRKNRVEGKECSHRNQSIEENLEKWKKMLKGKYYEGQAVLRLKTDMKHPNPAFRDRVLFRIVEREHPRVGNKFKVWPLLEFSWAVDDQAFGITHILRGKDLVIEDMVEEFIWDKLGLKKPVFIHYGLLNIKESKLSKTEARKAIESGKFFGWDDPRTWSLQSLRRRGIKPEAIRKFVLGMGLSLADVSVPAEILYAENRKIIDPIANRYFAILEPEKISVEKAPRIEEVEIPLHPDFPERGKRKLPVKIEKIYVEREDLKKLRNKEVGLINLFSVKLKKKAEFISEKIKMEVQKIQWVSEPNVKIKIIMPDGSSREGIAEPEVKNLKKDQIIQLQRIGFARVDEIDKEKVTLFFAHK
ncbi:MAG: glutamate--tRNA ligase, partial [Candidatus Aenigmatarchaeota archaeon]